MWAPLWLQVVLVLVWGLASFPLFYWSIRRCGSWRGVLADEAADAEVAPGAGRLFLFTVLALLTMFCTVALLTLGMMFCMEAIARLRLASHASG